MIFYKTFIIELSLIPFLFLESNAPNAGSAVADSALPNNTTSNLNKLATKGEFNFDLLIGRVKNGLFCH